MEATLSVLKKIRSCPQIQLSPTHMAEDRLWPLTSDLWFLTSDLWLLTSDFWFPPVPGLFFAWFSIPILLLARPYYSGTKPIVGVFHNAITQAYGIGTFGAFGWSGFFHGPSRNIRPIHLWRFLGQRKESDTLEEAVQNQAEREEPVDSCWCARPGRNRVP